MASSGLKHAICHKVSKLFEKYAIFVFDHACTVLWISFAIFCLLSTGLLFRHDENDMMTLYSIPGTHSDLARSRMEQTFDRHRGVTILGVSNDNIMSRRILEHIKVMQETATKVINVTYNELFGFHQTDTSYMKDQMIQDTKCFDYFDAWELRYLQELAQALPKQKEGDEVHDTRKAIAATTARMDESFGHNRKQYTAKRRKRKAGFPGCTYLEVFPYKLGSEYNVTEAMSFHNYTEISAYIDFIISSYNNTVNTSYNLSPLETASFNASTTLASVKAAPPSPGLHPRASFYPAAYDMSLAYEDVCVYTAKQKCQSLSFLDMYAFPKYSLGKRIAVRKYPEFTNIQTRRKVMADSVFANITLEEAYGGGSVIRNATGVLIYLTTRGNEDIKPFSMLWEGEVMNYLLNYEWPLTDSPTIDFHIFTERSINDELSRASTIDLGGMIRLVIGFGLLFIYAVLVNSTMDKYSTKTVSAMVGSVVSLLGYSAGAGFFYLLGGRHVPPADSTPFLVMGIGVDDAFVILNAFSLTYGSFKTSRAPNDLQLDGNLDHGLQKSISSVYSVTVQPSSVDSTFAPSSRDISPSPSPTPGSPSFSQGNEVPLANALSNKPSYSGGTTSIGTPLAGVLTADEARSKTKSRNPSFMLKAPLVPFTPTHSHPCHPSHTIGPCPVISSRDRLARTMGDAGLAITITTTTNLIAFAVGATSPFFAIRNFCIITSISLLFGYIGCLTVFLAVLCIDAKREEERSINFFSQCQPGRGVSRVQEWVRRWCGLGGSRDMLKVDRRDKDLDFPALQGASAIEGGEGTRSNSLCASGGFAAGDESAEPVSGEAVNASQIAEVAIESNENIRREEMKDEDAIVASEEMVYIEVPPHRKEPSPIQPSDVVHHKRNACCMQTPLKASPRDKSPENSPSCLGCRASSSSTPRLAHLSIFELSSLLVAYNSFVKLASTRVASHDQELVPTELLVPPSPQGSGVTLKTSSQPSPLGPASLPSDLPLKYCIEPTGNVGRLFRKFVMTYYAAFLSTFTGQVIVLLLFVVYLGVAIWGWAAWMQTGLSYYSIVSGHSYLRNFYDAREKYFGKYGEEVVVLFQEPETEWWRHDVQKEILWMNEQMEAADYTAVINNGFTRFLRSYPDLPEDKQVFLDTLYDWVNHDTYGQHYKSNFVFEYDEDDEITDLRSWKFIFFQTYINSSRTAWNWLVQCREHAGTEGYSSGSVPRASSEKSLSVIPARLLEPEPSADRPPVSTLAAPRLVHGDCFYYGALILEADPIILSFTLQNMGIALAAIVVVAGLAIPTVFCAFLVVGMIVMIDIGIFGFMSIWGVNMNLVSMVNLVMSIGFSVDHTAHVIHAFTHCVGPTRLIRMKECLVVICTPVFHGAISTWLAASCMCTSDKEILVIFFKMMTLVLLFSVAHGVILLPVLLSLIGPMPANDSQVDVYVRQLMPEEPGKDKICALWRQGLRRRTSRKDIRR